MLDERKLLVLKRMQQGESISSICRDIDVARSTVYHWINTDKEFKDAKAQMENKLLENLFTMALTEAEELLLYGSNYEKVTMIQQLLKLKKSNDVNLNVKAEVTSLDDMLKMIKH